MKQSRLLYTVTAMAVVSSCQTQSWLTNALAAYFPLDGNAADATGNDVNGILHDVSGTADRFGQASSALSFQGAFGSYVDMGAQSEELQTHPWLTGTAPRGGHGVLIFRLMWANFAAVRCVHTREAASVTDLWHLGCYGWRATFNSRDIISVCY